MGSPSRTRFRVRHVGGREGAPLRAVLHDKTSRKGHRARPCDRPRHRSPERRAREGGERAQPGHHVRRPASPRRSGPAPKIAEPPRALVVGGGTETVLVVEDDDAVRGLAVRTLRANGYDVVIAADGREVRDLSDEQVARLQLLLTDVIMPGLNGREVAEELRRRRPGLPVLYVSGYAADAFEGASADDSSGFLAKPFTAPTLLGRVREVLDRA